MENNFDSLQQLQLISANGDFTGGVNNYLHKLGLGKIGKSYNFVSIIGCQSTGKSTLLNKLFGTSFSTMDSTIARKQTTRGFTHSLALSINQKFESRCIGFKR